MGKEFFGYCSDARPFDPYEVRDPWGKLGQVLLERDGDVIAPTYQPMSKLERVFGLGFIGFSLTAVGGFLIHEPKILVGAGIAAAYSALLYGEEAQANLPD